MRYLQKIDDTKFFGILVEIVDEFYNVFVLPMQISDSISRSILKNKVHKIFVKQKGFKFLELRQSRDVISENFRIKIL